MLFNHALCAISASNVCSIFLRFRDIADFFHVKIKFFHIPPLLQLELQVDPLGIDQCLFTTR